MWSTGNETASEFAGEGVICAYLVGTFDEREVEVFGVESVFVIVKPFVKLSIAFYSSAADGDLGGERSEKIDSDNWQ